MRDQLAPVGAVRRGQRRDGDARKSMAPPWLVRMKQLVAAVVDAVAHAGLARRHQARRGIGVGEVDQPALGGLVVAGGDDAEAAEALSSTRTNQPLSGSA